MLTQRVKQLRTNACNRETCLHCMPQEYPAFDELELTSVIRTGTVKLAWLPNPFADYSMDWTSPNLSLVDLAVVCIT